MAWFQAYKLCWQYKSKDAAHLSRCEHMYKGGGGHRKERFVSTNLLTNSTVQYSTGHLRHDT